MTAEEHDFLFELIRDRQLTGQHLEVGTAAGGTLCAMMQCFAEQSRPPFVVVDRMTYFPGASPELPLRAGAARAPALTSFREFCTLPPTRCKIAPHS